MLDQAFDEHSMYQLRASVAAHAGRAGLTPARADDVVIAVHELAANVVRHGRGSGRLLLWRHHDELHCQITEAGDGQPAPDQEGERRPDTAGTDAADAHMDGPPWHVQAGHGLWLVIQLADRASWRADENGFATTIAFSLARPGPLGEFTLIRQTWPAGTTLAVTGPLDMNSATTFTEAVDGVLAAAAAARLIVDLTGLTFWDSFGLAALMRAQSRTAASAGARLVLAAVPERLRSELRDTGLIGRFTIADSTQQAIAQGSIPPP